MISVMALRCVARIGRNKMSYVLIVMWLYEAAYGSTSTSMEIEFNNLESCQATASLIKKQYSPKVLICAAKGEKK